MIKRGEGLYRLKIENIKFYKYYHKKTEPKDFNQQHWNRILEDTKRLRDVPVPILVVQDPSDGKYWLEDGYRRYHAAIAAGLTSVSAQLIISDKKKEKYPRYNPFNPRMLLEFMKKAFGLIMPKR